MSESVQDFEQWLRRARADQPQAIAYEHTEAVLREFEGVVAAAKSRFPVSSVRIRDNGMPVKVPSTWTALAAEIRRLNQVVGGLAEHAPAGHIIEALTDLATTADHLADLIIEGRVR